MGASTTLTESRYWLWPWEEPRGWLAVTALLGGTWSCAAPWTGERWSALAGALVLLLIGWLPFWRALTATDWTAALTTWPTWEQEAPLGRWPYLQPGTPGAALHRALRRARAWWAAEGQTQLAWPLRSAVMAFAISLLAAFMVGRNALVLTLGLLAWAELSTLWHEGRGTVGAGWEAPVFGGLPWLLGTSLAGSLTPRSLLAALVLMALVGLAARPSARLVVGATLTALFLVWAGHPFAAGVLLLLAFPPLLLILHRPTLTLYRRASLPWLLAMILWLAWTLR